MLCAGCLITFSSQGAPMVCTVSATIHKEPKCQIWGSIIVIQPVENSGYKLHVNNYNNVFFVCTTYLLNIIYL